MIYPGTRVGKFHVGRELLDDGFGPMIYEGMVPIEVRMLFVSDSFEVTALSDKFEPVGQGYEIPFYDIVMVGKTIDRETGRLGNWRPTFQRREGAAPVERIPWMGEAPTDDLSFRLKVYPNSIRTDGVFVAEDREVAPYPGISDMDGKPIYPAIPQSGRRLGVQLDHAFGEELVRRWNAHAPPLKPGFVD